MAWELRAKRYLDPNSKFRGLPEYIKGLKRASMKDALAFYAQCGPALSHLDKAFLGANDRFYLMTAFLQRWDVCQPWLYARIREVEADPDGYLDLWARYHYKDLSKKTATLTTCGWKDHGDLVPGDYVFSPSGKPVKVLATRSFEDSACYRVTFDNEISIECGAGHLWKVEVSSRKRVLGTWKGQEAGSKRVGREARIVETGQLASLGGAYRPCVRVTEPLDVEYADLPIDPYVLGAWLGDGTSSTGSLCGQDDEIFAEVERRGYRLSHSHCPSRAPFRLSTIYGLSTTLRHLGLIKNKHIPMQYMLASEVQRRELLWGIVDTDGNVSTGRNGCVTVAMKKKDFARQVQTLANSLGYKARVTPSRTTDSWHVVFQVSKSDQHPPCFLPRKRALLQDIPRRLGSRAWRVVSVEPIDTAPTNCIQVDSPDGMYLCGHELIPTHNSSIITFAGVIQEILIDPELTVAIFSHTKDIARAFLDQIKSELENNELLKTFFSDVLFQKPENDAPKWSSTDGIVLRRNSNPKEATVEAHGMVDGQPTSRHYGLIVYDDVVTSKSVTSPEIIKKTTIAWENSDNLAKSEGSRKWHAGTRWSFADSYGVILERRVLKPRIYPATDDGTIRGKPVFLTKERWAEITKTQKSTVSAQMLLNPVAGTDAMFLSQWFRTYEVVPAVMNVYIVCDPSKGRSKNSDRTAIAVIGVDPGGNKYLLDGYRHRMRLSQRYEFIKQLYIKWTTHPGVQMVRVGYEVYGAQADTEVIEEYQERDKMYFKIEELNYPRSGPHSKVARVERLEPDMKSGRFYLPAVVWNPDSGGRAQDARLRPNALGRAKDDRPLDNLCSWFVWTESHQKAAEASGRTRVGLDGRPLLHVGQIIHTPLFGLTKAQRRLEATGQNARIVTAILRRAEDNDLYDLTRAFIEEARFFPYAPHDDLIDVTARIYDMDVQNPVQYETSATMPSMEDDYIGGVLDQDGMDGIAYDA